MDLGWGLEFDWSTRTDRYSFERGRRAAFVCIANDDEQLKQQSHGASARARAWPCAGARTFRRSRGGLQGRICARLRALMLGRRLRVGVGFHADT